MFVWTSDFQNPLAHTHFNTFEDEWTSANESPAVRCKNIIFLQLRLRAIITALNWFSANVLPCSVFFNALFHLEADYPAIFHIVTFLPDPETTVGLKNPGVKESDR